MKIKTDIRRLKEEFKVRRVHKQQFLEFIDKKILINQKVIRDIIAQILLRSVRVGDELVPVMGEIAYYGSAEQTGDAVLIKDVKAEGPVHRVLVELESLCRAEHTLPEKRHEYVDYTLCRALVPGFVAVKYFRDGKEHVTSGEGKINVEYVLKDNKLVGVLLVGVSASIRIYNTEIVPYEVVKLIKDNFEEKVQKFLMVGHTHCYDLSLPTLSRFPIIGGGDDRDGVDKNLLRYVLSKSDEYFKGDEKLKARKQIDGMVFLMVAFKIEKIKELMDKLVEKHGAEILDSRKVLKEGTLKKIKEMIAKDWNEYCTILPHYLDVEQKEVPQPYGREKVKLKTVVRVPKQIEVT